MMKARNCPLSYWNVYSHGGVCVVYMGALRNGCNITNKIYHIKWSAPYYAKYEGKGKMTYRSNKSEQSQHQPTTLDRQVFLLT